ncbi:MAG TPA: nuclear transport factor 2 family protein [Verrucomicrobiae bacterium]|nr:nuclear transport factor 2 family protein [Verrucomicrobiae bacterium]
MSNAVRYLSPRGAVSELRLLNARFIENFIRNDVKSHDAMLHADFIGIQGDGSRIDRASYLKKWAKGFDPEVIVYWDVRDELITLIGNTALVRATNKEICRSSGQDITGMSTYTDTYLYEGGAWKCIQAQITPVAPGREPGDDTIISVYIKGVRQ